MMSVTVNNAFFVTFFFKDRNDYEPLWERKMETNWTSLLNEYLVWYLGKQKHARVWKKKLFEQYSWYSGKIEITIVMATQRRGAGGKRGKIVLVELLLIG